jgi:AcrR family transcriptional regulator
VTDTKARIVAKTAELLRRQGFHGTGLKQIVAEAGAPFGSLYHFFPGGKDELGAEVIRSAGGEYQQLIEAVFDAAPDLVSGVRACFDGAAALLRETQFADACPIATVALEVASTNPPLRVACAEVFEGWILEARRRFLFAGVARREARELALVMIAALEGAFVLSRTLQSPEPVEAAGRAVAAVLTAALAPRRARARRRRSKPRTANGLRRDARAAKR